MADAPTPTPRVKATASKPNVGAFSKKTPPRPLAVGDADGWIPRQTPPPRTPAAKKRTPVRDDDPCKTCGARPPVVVFGRFATSGARKATCEPCLAKQRTSRQKPPPPPPSISMMKDAIARAGLSTADLLERSDVEARYREALTRLPRADADATRPDARHSRASSFQRWLSQQAQAQQLSQTRS